MRTPRTTLGLSFLLGSLTCAGVRADTEHLTFRDPPTPAPPTAPADPGSHPTLPDRFAPEWLIQIDPTLWFVGPSGKFKLPVNSGSGPGGFTTEGDSLRVNDLNLASTRIRPAGTLTVATGKWRFSFWGSQYEVARSNFPVSFSGRLGAAAFAAGDHLKLDLALGTYELTAGYRIWDHDFGARSAHPESAVDALFTLHLLGGLRLYDLGIDAENLTTPARADGSHFFAEPVIGVRAEAIIDTDFSVIVQLSAGGLPLYSTKSYSLDVVAAFQWRPFMNVGVQIGWRQLAFDLQNGRDLDKFQYTGRLAGLFTGVVIRF